MGFIRYKMIRVVDDFQQTKYGNLSKDWYWKEANKFIFVDRIGCDQI